MLTHNLIHLCKDSHDSHIIHVAHPQHYYKLSARYGTQLACTKKHFNLFGGISFTQVRSLTRAISVFFRPYHYEPEKGLRCKHTIKPVWV
jgi:hypothetical protein